MSSRDCAQRRLQQTLRCLLGARAASSNEPKPSSAVPGEGIDLVGGGGTTKFEPGSGKLGSRTGSSALRVSLGAPSGLITSANPLSSMAGTRVLLAGGNAFDAALAVGATLNVVEPMSSSIAGNGFSTIFDVATGQVHSLAMAGAAPLAVDGDSMSEEELSQGYGAACTPGNMGGYLALIERFGTMSLADTLQYAIEYAHGHPLSEATAAAINAQAAVLNKWRTSAALFLPGGSPPKVGETWANHGLAKTLKRVVAAEHRALARGCSREEGIRAGYDEFYTGAIAKDITNYFASQEGGLLSMEDLANYSPGWEEPIHVSYRGYDIYSNPSTTRGGLEVLMGLNLLEGWDIASYGDPNHPMVLHLQAEAIKVSKACIYEHVGDPAYKQVPYEGLLSKEYAALRRALISENSAMKTAEPGDPFAFNNGDSADSTRSTSVSTNNVVGRAAVKPGGKRLRSESYYDSPDTTSFSVLDADGNVVCCTPTIGEGFGTRVVCGETGMLFNNGMRIGSTSPYPGNVNYVRPGQIPLLNNSPVIVLRHGRLKLAMGTPGGEAIGQTQLQCIMNVLDFELTVQEAIETPRFRLAASPNFYLPGNPVSMSLESRVPEETVKQLRSWGHDVQASGPYSICAMQGILVDLETGAATAGADPRGGYYAVGY